MLDLILYQPEIPPNTGNVIRLAANTGMRLHLVKPLGFRLSDKALIRAGLDYHSLADVTVHADWHQCMAQLGAKRIYAFSTRGGRLYTDVQYAAGDALLFGSESCGLPQAVLEKIAPSQLLRLPLAGHSRSLNLANAVAVAAYEAWRQLGFPRGS